MATSPHLNEERKRAILDAATAVFARQGFYDTRLEDIAREAGMSKSALYHHFKTKGMLGAAIIHRFYEQGLQELRLLDSTNGPVSKRIDLFTSYVIAGLGQLAALLALSPESSADPNYREEVRAFLKEYFSGYQKILVQLIQEGIARGEFQPVNPETTASLFASLYEGQALLWAERPIFREWELSSERTIQTLLDGLRVKA